MFLQLQSREGLFGGAAGPGKSSALLMAALEYVQVPGYAAILFRRSFTDLALPGALMDRAHDWLQGTDADWNGQDKRWTFPGSGATLTFGYMDHETDRFRYQGAEFAFIGFDELTQFTETQYRYLLSRLRRNRGLDVPLRMRAASNPGGVGHEWVKRRFLVEGPKEGRAFVPAKLADNPHLDQAAYRESLAGLDDVTRAQLEDGRWDVVERGPMFDRAWFDVVDEVPPQSPDHPPRKVVRYWDLAATKQLPGNEAKPWTAGVKESTVDGEYYVEHVERTQGDPGEVEDLIKRTAEEDGVEVPIRMEQEPGSGGVNTIDHYARQVLAGYDFAGDKKTGDKVSSARPLSSAAKRGHVHLVRGDWNTAFIDEAHVFPQPGFAKDQIDAASGGQRYLTGGEDPAETFRNQAKW